MAPSFFKFVLLCLFVEATEADFTGDMSRKAEDWVPVAQCRAYCLDVFGKYFGETTSEYCTTKSLDCFRCWNDCACSHFKPKPLWDVCSPVDKCEYYAGCRRAIAHNERTNNQIYEKPLKNESEWTVDGYAALTGNKMYVITTLKNSTSLAKYSSPAHLIFSLSYKKGDSWLQLTQEPLFGYNLDIGNQIAPECHEGCDLRVVVANDSSILADVTFPYRAPLNFSLQAVLDAGSGSPLSAKLKWQPYLSESPEDSVYRLTWHQIPSRDANQTAGDTGSILLPFNATNLTISTFDFSDLKYNSVYHFVVSYNTTKYAVRYELRDLKTPECNEPDQTLLHCADKETAAPLQQPQNSTALVILIPIAAVMLILAAGLFVWMYRRRRERENSIVRSESQSPLSRNEVYLAGHCPGERLPIGVKREDVKIGSLLHKGEFILTKTALKHNAVVSKRADSRLDSLTGRESFREVRLQVEYEILSMVPSHHNFVKLYGYVENPREAILTLLEATSSPLDEMLRHFRKVHALENGLTRIYLTGLRVSTIHGASNKMEVQWTACTPRQLIAVAEQVSKGVAYLNSRGVVHGGLCANNILCDNKFQVRIHGLSNASRLEASKRHLFANVEKYSRWLPPEVLNDGKFAVSLKTDVWSFGVVLWELVTLGCVPYHTGDVKKLREMLGGKFVLEQPPTCGNVLYQFMRACWNREPKDRPNMAEVHDLIEEFVKTPADPLEINFDKIPDLEKMNDTPNDDNRYLLSTTSDSVFEAESMADNVFESVSRQSAISAVEPSLRSEPTSSSVTDSLRAGCRRAMEKMAGVGSYSSSRYSNV